MARRKKTAEKREEEEFAELRGYGEDEMRRRWREAEAAGVLDRDPNRIFFLREVEEWAEYARPENMRRIRRDHGDREAEFRQGIADEAYSLLRRTLGLGYRLGEIGQGEWLRESENRRR